MAKFVHEIMNQEIFSLTPDAPAKVALNDILRLGITGAPVLDETGRPVGLVSLRDLVGVSGSMDAGEIMTSPAVVIEVSKTIKEAARTLGRTSLHRLVVVSDDGRAVGIVSAIDVIRGLIGMAPTHPDSFPHFDDDTGRVWTDLQDLSVDTVLARAPDAPGVFVLIHDAPGVPDSVVWAEAAENVTSRLMDLVVTEQPPTVSRILAYKNLRFRATSVADPVERAGLLAQVQATITPWPGA